MARKLEEVLDNAEDCKRIRECARFFGAVVVAVLDYRIVTDRIAFNQHDKIHGVHQ